MIAAPPDPSTALDGLLRTVGLERHETGGSIVFDGADPIVPSVLAVGTAAAAAATALHAAAAIAFCERGGEGQDITTDVAQAVHTLGPRFHPSQPVRLNDVPVSRIESDAALGNAVRGHTFYTTADGRYVRPACVGPRLRDGMADFLGVAAHDAEAVQRAIGSWEAEALEAEVNARGLILAMARTPEEWADSEQGRALAAVPVVSITRIGDSAPEPMGPAERPLSGVRAVGITRALAGPTMGSSLAGHGADVLNLWSPPSVENVSSYLIANLGMRSAYVDLRSPEGAGVVQELVRGADVFFESRREGMVAGLGVSPEECAALRPGIVVVSGRCYGHVGPWAHWAGFDATARPAIGMSLLEGDGRPAPSPTGPINDFLVGWLGALGAIAALVRRSREGGSYLVQVSLCRTGMWVLDLGRIERNGVPPAVQARVDRPVTYRARTALGEYQGLASPVQCSRTPVHYDPVMVPRGSDRPHWR